MNLKALGVFTLLCFFSISLFSQPETKAIENNYQKFKQELPVAEELVTFGLDIKSSIPLITAAELLMKYPFAIQSTSETINPKKILVRALQFVKARDDKHLIDIINKLQKEYDELEKASTPEVAEIDFTKFNTNQFYYERFILKPKDVYEIRKVFNANAKAEVRIMTAEVNSNVAVKIFDGKNEIPDFEAINECNEIGVRWKPSKKRVYTIIIKNMGTENSECFLFTN